MANSTKGTGPWSIDTASATPITSEVIQIESITWDTGTTGAANDECKLTTNDATPVVLVDWFAQGADGHIKTKMSKTPINGLICPTLSHGVVHVYLRGA